MLEQIFTLNLIAYELYSHYFRSAGFFMTRGGGGYQIKTPKSIFLMM